RLIETSHIACLNPTVIVWPDAKETDSDSLIGQLEHLQLVDHKLVGPGNACSLNVPLYFLVTGAVGLRQRRKEQKDRKRSIKQSSHIGRTLPSQSRLIKFALAVINALNLASPFRSRASAGLTPPINRSSYTVTGAKGIR